MEDKNIHYRFKSIVSFSHLFGCITTLGVNFIRDAFSRDFFKTIKITTEVPFEERRKFGQSLISKPTPMLIVNPKVDLADDTDWLSNSELDYMAPNDTSGPKFFPVQNAIELINDNTQKYQLLTTRRRYKITYDMIFKFNSEMQKMQAFEFIRQNIRHNSPMVIERHIEVNIPEQFMKAIAYIEQIDINSDDFLLRLNQQSNIPITHRIRPGSGNREFFVLMPATLHLKFTSLPSDNGNDRKGNLITSSSFGENLVVEFTSLSTFYLKTPIEIPATIPMDDRQLLYTTTIKPVDSTKAELDMILEESYTFANYKLAFKKAAQLKAQFDSDDDALDLTPYLKGLFKRAYDYHKTHKIPITFVEILVTEGVTLIAPERFLFDPETLLIRINNVDKFNTYTIGVYIDQVYVNDLIQSLYSLDRAFESN